MEFKQLLEKRRSVRRFGDTPVSRAVVLDVLNMALTAPSARNSRSTRFLVVDDRATIEKMASMRDYGSAFMAKAPVAVVVMGDTTASDIWDDNCAISATVLQLACVEAGLASCWVHVAGRPRRKDEPQGESAEEYLRTLLPIPDHCRVECIIAMGYSDFTPAPLPEFDPSTAISWSTEE